MHRFKLNKQKIKEFLFDILLFILFIGAVLLLQIIQTIAVNENYPYCDLTSEFWQLRILTIAIISLFYDFVFFLLRKICQRYQKGYLIAKLALSVIFIAFMIILFAAKLQKNAIVFITTSLYTINLCQIHSILYNKSNVIIKCILNYALLVLIVPTSYLCSFFYDYKGLGSYNGIYVGMIFCYMGAIGIMILLSFKTDKLRRINLQQQSDEQIDETLLQKIQSNRILNKKQQTAKCVIFVYSILFQFISIYLNTNGAAIQEVFTYNAFSTSAIIYSLIIVLYLPLVKLVTIEDGVNILVVLNIILLFIKIFTGLYTIDIFNFPINTSIVVAGFSQMLPMLISTLYKNYYNILIEDQYMRLSLSFNFISFYFQNFQFKRMYFLNSLYFIRDIPYSNSRMYYESMVQPSIQIGLSLLYLAQFQICYRYFKNKIRNFKQIKGLKS